MIRGGSAGLNIITALSRFAPPTFWIAWKVVSVNSSELARVPGPADFEAMEATKAMKKHSTEPTSGQIQPTR